MALSFFPVASVVDGPHGAASRDGAATAAYFPSTAEAAAAFKGRPAVESRHIIFRPPAA